MHIKIKKISALEARDRTSLLQFGESEIKRLDDIKNEKRKNESATALLALSEIIDKEVSAQIYRNDDGRPCLKNEKTADVSLSHSASLAVAAFSLCGRVGVDIEKIDKSRASATLAKRFFTDEENLRFGISSEPVIEFFSIWTKKEATAKCLGLTLSESLGQSLRAPFVSTFFVDFEAESYVMSIAQESKDEIKIISEPQMEIRKLSI